MNKMFIQVLRCFVPLLALSVLVHAQDQPGFISIDCGADKSYTDESTTIYYSSDAPYVETGMNMDVSPLYNVAGLEQQLKNVRSFPQGDKNCYTLRPAQGRDTNYLVRAYFMYGNYDSLNKPPTFALHLGVDVWDTVKLDNSSQIVMKEIIHTPSADYLYVCVVNTGYGTPFISGLELRHVNDTIYKRQSGSLDLLYRYYTYTTSLNNIRYEDDIFDRIWAPMYLIGGSSITTTSEVNSILDVYNLPSSVMKAAIVPANLSQPISFSYTSTDPSTEYYIYLNVAELAIRSTGQIREFNVSVNGQHFYGPYVPLYLTADTIFSTKSLIGSQLNITIQRTSRSTLPPLLNAIEIFSVKKLTQRLTYQADVDAIMNIKSLYNLTKNWQGDPCVPEDYIWSGLNCSYESSSSPRIISLNLSSSKLTGGIAASISNLTAQQVLNLSKNKLSGQIPDFLAELPSLKTLNLAENNFTGSVPEKLLERSRKGSLALSMGNSTDPCSGTTCSSKKKRNLVPPIAASAALVVLLSAGLILFLIIKRRNSNNQKPKAEAMQVQVQTATEVPVYSERKGGLARFSYSEVTNMTKGFQRELGKGGFGTVYYGCLKDGTEVAVKKLSPSIHASEQFSTEVELLMAISHKNLVSLVGYCEEGTNLALVYEYMAGGNLQTVLSASQSLSWKQRLQIAIDAAQGLDYLHSGCRPPIVHRDVKTPNILLNKNLQAKMADFGLSKIFPDEHRSYVSTRVIGTPGYVDPEYHVTQQLNEKSDVYSFGIVLLELITGKAAIVKNSELERTSLVYWVSPILESGDIWNIVDERLQEVHNPNSVWRATDIAMSCVKPTAFERPSMGQVVTELKDCLAMDNNAGNSRMGPDDSFGMSPVVSFTAMGPAAR